MKRLTLGLLALVAVFANTGCSACTEVVDAGYVGMRIDSDGLDGKVLEPGRHDCGFRCKVIRIETEELLMSEKLNVLCSDNLNIKIDVKVRARLKIEDGEGVKALLDKQGSKIKNNILEAEVLYATYVQPQVRAITRRHVSQFSTTQIRENRALIEASIKKDLLEEMKITPVEIMMVVTSNIDYPEVITKAEESKKARQLQIEQEKAQHAMELLKAENNLKIAQANKAVKVAEAEGEAAANKIIGSSATAQYLRLKGIEAQMLLYKQMGAGDILITDGKVPPALLLNR